MLSFVWEVLNIAAVSEDVQKKSDARIDSQVVITAPWIAARNLVGSISREVFKTKPVANLIALSIYPNVA